MITALRRYPLLVLLPVIVLAAAGVVIGLKRTATYTASMELNVGVPSAGNQATPGYVTAAQTLASSYGREATSDLILDPLSLQRRISPATLATLVSVSVVPNSPTLYVNATGSSSTRAISLANATGDLLQSRVNAAVSQSLAGRLLISYRAEVAQADRLDAYASHLAGLQKTPGSGVTLAQYQSARLRAQVAQLRAQAQANRYSNQVTYGPESTNLVVLNRAVSASSNRTTMTERFGLVGVLAGLVIGAALAFLVARLRARRPAAMQ